MGPTRLSGGSDAVEVWVAAIDAALPRTDAFWPHLSESERGRAGRLRREDDARRFVVARGLLRVLLGMYLDAPPARVALEYGPRGKPRLAGRHGDAPIRFSLSHAGDAALYAVARHRDVGVDLERIDAGIAWRDVAATFFSPAEDRRLRSLPADEGPAAFLRLWTRREAWLKARGDGLSGLDRNRAAEPAWAALSPGPGCWTLGDAETTWALVDLDVLPGYVAALAVEAGGAVAPVIRAWPIGPDPASAPGA